MRVKKVIIFENSKNPETYKVANEITSLLTQEGINSTRIKLFVESNPPLDDVKFDLAISLGGDGTVLTAAKLLERTKIPILAINMGTFGYITETSLSEYREILERAISGKVSVESRMRLEVIIKHKEDVLKSTALNDICLGAMSHSKLAKISLSVNETLASNLKGDGIIISTPTGSTAYNLSAGGPILSSGLESIVINPICPFTMGFRPLVISDEDVIDLTIPEQATKLMLTVDGNDFCEITGGDLIQIKRSNSKTYIIANDKRNHIEVLRDKLGWAGGFNA